MGNWESLISDIEELPDNLRDEVESEVDSSLQTMERTSKAHLRHNDTNYRGETRASIYQQASQPNGEGHRGFVKKLSAGGPTAPHAAIVEFGTGTYFGTGGYPIPKRQKPIPSPDYISAGLVANIADWVQEKNITSNTYHQPIGLSIAISQEIVKKGTPAQPFFRPAYFEEEQQTITNVKGGVRDAIRDVG